jgi:hypothetical protein
VIRRVLTALALLYLPAAPVLALTPQDLLREQQLRVQAVIDSEPPHYQRAPLILAVEIATPRWFSRGPRVRDFRVPGAIVLPVSSFADKLTRREGGDSWTLQRWRYRVFPRDAGRLEFPQLTVFVSVNHDSGEIVEGDVRLRPPAVNIVAPAGLDDGEWVAARSLEVEESWQGQRGDYRVGDAITRERVITVDDAPAMMIPPSPAPGAAEGLSLYHAPPQVTDRRDRGRLVGVRREQLVATIEAPGDYELPGAEFLWFNTESGALEIASLPPYRFRAAAGGENRTGAAGEALAPRRLLAPALLITLLLALLAAYRLRRHPRLQPAAAWLQTRQQRHHYLRALQRGDAAAALAALTLAVQRRGGTSLATSIGGDPDSAAALRRLLDAAYGAAPTGLPAAPQARHLWQTATGTQRRAPARQEGLSLNPHSRSS